MQEIVFDKNTKFGSERLKFRGIEPDDADNLVRWRSRQDIYSISGQARPITMDEHLHWFNEYMASPKALRLIISEASTGMDIGMVGGALENGVFILSYYIGEDDFRRKGFVSEAITCLLQYLEQKYINRFEAHIKPDNIGSINCVERLGFVKDRLENSQIVYMKVM